MGLAEHARHAEQLHARHTLFAVRVLVELRLRDSGVVVSDGQPNTKERVTGKQLNHITHSNTPGRQHRPASEGTSNTAPVDVGSGVRLQDVGERVFNILENQKNM